MTAAKTLILEDNPSVRSTLLKAVQAAGFDADAVASSTEFYAKFAKQEPSTVILDVVLGDGDVCEVLDFLGRSGIPPQVILMSGYDYRILHSMARLAKDRGLRILDVVEKRSDSGARLVALLRSHSVGPLPDSVPGTQK